MKKSLVPVAALLFILCIVFGSGACGGGGGGSSTTTTTTGGLNPIRAEAALAATPNEPIDPLNIQAGDSVVFQVAGYDANRQRHILPSANWTTNDNGNVVGVLQPDGNFSATSPLSGTNFTASGVANGTTYSEQYRVKVRQALVTGFIMDSNGFGASHVIIVFYNSAGSEVSECVAQFDGSFRASVPTTAVSFNLFPPSMPTQFYYRSFVYQTKRYTALIKSCSPSLPALTNGTTTAIGTITVDAAETNGNPNPPPPPPDGCPV